MEDIIVNLIIEKPDIVVDLLIDNPQIETSELVTKIYKGEDGKSVTDVEVVFVRQDELGGNVYKLTTILDDGQEIESGEFTAPKGQQGEQGEKGDDGADGKSAYQYAVEGGYQGTEAQFTSDLGDIETKTHASNTYATQNDLETTNTNVETALEGVSENAQAIQELSNVVDTKQDILVSGQNIKTINGSSILGSGDLELSTASKYVLETTGEFGTFTEAQYNLLVDNTKNVVIKNGVEEYTLKATETNYRTYMAQNTPTDTTLNHYVIYVNTSEEAVNFRHWSKEQIDPYTKVEQSDNNGYIEVNGTDTKVYELPSSVLQQSDVVNNVTSTDTNKPLSANMGKELQAQIDNVKGLGRYLSQWNATTGLPTTNPTESPYSYRTGDYYRVGTVASAGGTNYKPSGTQYVTGVASTAVETDTDIKIDDIYFYDGTSWTLQKIVPRDVSFANILGNATDNTSLANALNSKQDNLEFATSISDSPSNNKVTTESSIYNYVASGNGGKPRALSSVDLNTISATGFYSCNVCTNRPTENNGVMLVLKNALASDNVVQVYWTYTADVMWVRHKDLGNWKEWRSILKSGDVDLTGYYTKNETDGLLNDKQNSTDNNLTTTSKNIVGAINELDSFSPVLYDVGSYQDTYDTYVIPKILKTDAQAIYNLAKTKVPVKMKWAVLGIVTTFEVLETSEASKSFSIFIHNGLHINYSYESTTDYATYEVVGGGGDGTVTSITAGTGLSGGTITTSGTIALSSATQTSLGKADTAVQPSQLNTKVDKETSYVDQEQHTITTEIRNNDNGFSTLSGRDVQTPHLFQGGLLGVTKEKVILSLSKLGGGTSFEISENTIKIDAPSVTKNNVELATVDDIPTVNNSTITITQGGVTKGSFTLNQSSGQTIALDAGGGESAILYSTTGQNTDGAMTQKATTDELAKKVEFVEDTTGSADPSPLADYYNKSQVDNLLSNRYTKTETNNLLNNKADTNLSNVTAIRTSTTETHAGKSGTKYTGKHLCIESWKSNDGTMWYRKYDDGWKECGGIITSTATTSSGTNINLPLEFSDSNYTVAVSAYEASHIISTKVNTNSTSQINVVCGVQGVGYYSSTVRFYCCGY